MKKYLIISILGLLFFGCAKDNRWDCFTSYGHKKTEVRQLSEFSAIFLSDRIDMEYYQADDYRVEVVFGDNVIKHINTEVKDGELRISNDATCNWVRDLSKHPLVKVFAPSFTYIENRSAGDITFRDTLEAVDFKYEQWESNGVASLLVENETTEIVMHVGFCEVEARGISEQVGLYSAAVGELDASNLITPVTLANNSSIQPMRLYASDYLYAEINARGDIRYAGEPQAIETAGAGTGNLTPL
jgi:hypothetical protein